MLSLLTMLRILTLFRLITLTTFRLITNRRFLTILRLLFTITRTTYTVLRFLRLTWLIGISVQMFSWGLVTLAHALITNKAGFLAGKSSEYIVF